MKPIIVVGGGFAGLVAAITCAELGAPVRLLEAHRTLGGRARATAPPYVAQDGPRALYADGEWWAWLARRKLIGPYFSPRIGGVYFRHHGALRRTPPLPLVRVLLRRTGAAPVDVSFADWVGGRHGPQAARLAANLMGVATFDADPGRLSAAFVWERLRRVFAVRPPARYPAGGWNGLIDRLAEHARSLGVEIETGVRVTSLPRPPVIVATSLDAARPLLGDLPEVESGHTLLLDLAVRARRGDAHVVSDLDEAGWLERFSAIDPGLAPEGESLVQAQMPIRSGESRGDTLARLEALVDPAIPGWRDRLTWRREAVARRRSGALDLPGRTWRDRPRVDRGDGVWLVGDLVAAPGLLSEVSFHSAVAAAHSATRRYGARTRPGDEWRPAAGVS
ncbi:MAG TPA: NAD(P)-binding protein [Actinoplanes sp.]|nr:NAD(P)-binding protein [Actinoplanes sp.]